MQMETIPLHHVITCIALIGASSGSAEPIEIKERLSPKNMVQIVKGQCGEHQYSMELTNTNQTKVLSVSVDGKPVSAEEIKRVTGAVAPGYFLFDPKFPECFWIVQMQGCALPRTARPAMEYLLGCRSRFLQQEL